jgi:hypothetical protein
MTELPVKRQTPRRSSGNYVGIWSIVPLRHLGMPHAIFILVLDVGRVTRDVLLGSDPFGRCQSSQSTGKGLRENIV